ncbi:centrosomal protein of 290 kDa isoform X1 [Pteropus vampyrus]|uniref:Centrosomal protein of 290 kDa isoform X1 n=2 Tax=Pteropus vampyrus TaxID=132908 RepID=A0A6P6CIN0_PTEVA|nr:centrosomal protein of 290 kDa isoform X1 [Pteropus vampyrus]XP_011360046.1 centrosomal protein of 290 kDa isoform X1 [Pteropus vampyrus]XP_023387305.1 centrosomal protein of 290 kDa isoform X1 [Pteropus vampyrus]XP_023387306.1 centrosomal protein of 290 kDa isoform X1 [Pteropus vampyrus]XP_023387307.1 centrosomal protein of 290 kDa isoform X1 [Pteropus vampyrus]XP_023387308.1 centrosomal protein of 290 kDa isoform X1 [Pteropus vampyrus]XP_023387309.1 centrosomal protein of 290 kDa isoform
MPPNINWKEIIKVDPDDLPRQEELADNLLVSLSKVEVNELKNESQENMIHLFRITQSLMKMKAQEVELALEEVEKAGEEQAKFENQLKTKVMKLENELEMAQQSAGGRDTRFLRDEIRQLEKQLEQKDRELEDMEKELEKEKKVNEQLALRNEEAENENSKLRRENEQLRQDIIDYQKQIDSQKETLLSRRGEDSDYRSQLSKKNCELVQYLDEIQTLTEANEKIEVQNQEMRKNLEESVQEMEKMTDEYNRMKAIVHQTDNIMDQLKKENDYYRLQVQELTDLLKAKNEEDDPVMVAVNAKVEEWKVILSSKDDEIIEYQQMLHNLREKLKNAQLDADKSNIMALQQGIQERDSQIKMLTEQVEQYTKEMEKNTFIIEDLKNELQRNKGTSTLSQQTHYMKIQSKIQILEEKTKEAERTAELAEADAREKDKELVETLKRLKDYESGIYGLEEAVIEIKNCKNQIKIRDREIEVLTKEINKLEMKINDFLDENEALRERMGLDPKTMIDLTEFRNSKSLKQQQYRAENQILLKEIESLEEERLDLKKKIRQMAQEKGKRIAASGLTIEDLNLTENFLQENRMGERKFDFMSLKNISETQSKNEVIAQDLLIKEAQSRNAEIELERHRSQAEQNEFLSRELIEKERDLERSRTIITKFQNKLRELVEENKQLEEGMKEILQAIKEMQKDPDVKGGEISLIIPSLERLVNAIESKNAEGIFDANLHLKAQVDQLTGRNEELRQELRESRKEAINYSQQLAKANLKVDHLEKETSLLRQSEGSNVVFKGIELPDGIAPSSTNIINSLNEYLIHILQELEYKENKLKNVEDSLEDYNRKFAVIRHQQSLLYKEYLSEKETWKIESETMKVEKRKLEDQIQHDAIKVKEYNNLLSTLKMDSDEMKKTLSENSRKITVLQVNEKSLIRQYTTLIEMERQLRKENEKQKNELISMEAEVSEKIGRLQRFKEMAIFKIAALQKVIDNSVSLSELELANKQYNELTAKYRDILQKDNILVQRTNNLEHLECENASLKEQMESMNKELEITKEKLHTIEQAWEQETKLGNESNMDKTKKSITNSEIASISKKITMLEMKELNERQRAEHSQKMYEHIRTSLKQMEERNFELETKFAELTKINLEAQRIEQMLRDELANSVSKTVSDADRQRILELEKNEMELKVEVSKLREISDIAKRQVEILNAQQQSREKEVESIRMQLLDYQAQSDEKALIAKLHQHLVSLQISEATALGKLESVTSKLQKMEAYNLRLEQKLDEKEQALYYARLEGRNRAKHLRQTIQSLRRQFSGALPLAQQEKFSKTMIQLQNDKLKIMQEMKNSQQEHRNMENKTMEMELKLKGLEELISTLKDARGAQKVISWHVKIEELRLQELKLNRELVKDKEEIKYLNNIISEYEHTIGSLEEEIVQQNKFHEERQMAWDQREVELERQLDIFDRQQNEILNAAQKFEEVTGSMPDPSLPLPNQLEIALRKIKENVRIILETRATCKSLEEKLKEKESALWLAEQNILSRDKVINELRLRLPATAEREKVIAELSRKELEPQSHHTLKIAQQTIANMQARLNQKEEVLKKYQHLLEKAREEQREIVKKHEEDLHILHHKLELQADSSLNKFKQTAWDLIKQSPTPVPTNKHFIRLAEMEQTLAEQDDSLSSLLIKLKKVSQDLERQKEITELKIKEFEHTKLRLQENHADEVKKVKAEVEDLKCLLAQSQKESQSLKSELQAQKEANSRAPTTTMRNLVERLKSQLALKEKQQKALSRALLELRAEMTAAAEERIISATSQKEANLNVQQIVDRHTKELKSQIEDLNENLLKLKEALKTSKNRENSLTDNLNDLTNELQRKQKAYNKMLREKDGIDQENDELKRQIKRLTSGLQGRPLVDNKQSLIEELQKKIKKLESQLERKVDEVEIKPVKEKSAREELIRWEEGKKWQSKIEGIRNKLKEKEGEVYILTKQLNTLKDLFAKADKEKLTLQKKLKTTGMTVNQVMGVRALESEKELEELKMRNLELENDVSYMRTHQALPRDSVIEDLRLQNRYLQEKLHALEKQCSKDTYSGPSTSEIESDDHWQREQELQKENLKLSSENIELKFQLEQANKDLPRLKNQVRDLKEMCEFLKKGKTEVERKLGHVRGSGRSGKTIPELEKTIGLMKKVVEKVQRENEQLKKASGILTSEKMANIELENEKLKAELEKLKVHLGRQLSMHYESKTKGTEKIVAENERLRKELKKETEAAEKLRIAKNNLEILNEKMTVQLEETGKRLQLAESRGPQLEGADSKSWKSIVVTRMYETKLKELETDIAKKTRSLTDLKQLVRQATEREQKVKKYTEDLEQQIEILKHIPEGAETEQGLQRELQLLRLANSQLEKEKAELIHQIEVHKDQSGAESTIPDPDQLKEKIKDLETQLKTSDLEKQHMEEEIKKLKKELENFDPSFFEEIEDLKYNYKEEVKKNILLEEKLKKLSEQFGVELTSPVAASEQFEDEEGNPDNFPIY